MIILLNTPSFDISYFINSNDWRRDLCQQHQQNIDSHLIYYSSSVSISFQASQEATHVSSKTVRDWIHMEITSLFRMSYSCLQSPCQLSTSPSFSLSNYIKRKRRQNNFNMDLFRINALFFLSQPDFQMYNHITEIKYSHYKRRNRHQYRIIFSLFVVDLVQVDWQVYLIVINVMQLLSFLCSFLPHLQWVDPFSLPIVQSMVFDLLIPDSYATLASSNDRHLHEYPLENPKKW